MFYCFMFYPSLFGNMNNDILFYFGNIVKFKIECITVVYMTHFFYLALGFRLLMACV